ncbi:DUF2459 domain-containing protein [Thiolapillus sp.]
MSGTMWRKNRCTPEAARPDGAGKAWIRLCFLFLLTACAACAAPVGEAPVSDDAKPRKTVYLVSHGWHAGIVVSRDDVPEDAWPILADFPDAKYLEIGWGDKDFYETPDPHAGIVLKAALLPSASVLHVVGFSDAVPRYFSRSEIIRIDLPAAGFHALIQGIGESFARDGSGKADYLGPGLYGDSRFYLSRERYHLFNTCNAWTARRLRRAGLPIRSLRSIRVEGLMSQARKLGRVISHDR